MILATLNSERNERSEVMVPAPAIIGKARGTTEAVSGASSRYRVIPNIISKARKKMTREPATAKEFISIPISFNIFTNLMSFF